MGLVEQQQLVGQISPPLDSLLATMLIEEFVSLERRFIQRDWEPAELDGGQFAEIAARAIYSVDSGNLNREKKFEDCCKYIENDQVSHAVQPRKNAIHIFRVLKTIYKFRSDRGAVHISATYGPNEMDARLIVEMSRWSMAEILRVFGTSDRDTVARQIREILQFDVPCIGKYEDVLLVQRTDVNVEEEVLLLLHYAGDGGMPRRDVGRFVLAAAPRVTEALQKLSHSSLRQVVQLPSGNYRLTDLGIRRIRIQLVDKLLLE